jgi:hypothetical protein
MKDFGLSHDVPVKRGQTALLFVDVQNYSAEGGGKYAGLSPEIIEARYGYFFREMRERVVPNMRRLQKCLPKGGRRSDLYGDREPDAGWAGLGARLQDDELQWAGAWIVSE